MSLETPKLITGVPTQAELEARKDNASNFYDPAQLAQHNANRQVLGLPEREAPGPFQAVSPEPAPRIEREPEIEPVREQTKSAEHMRQLRAQLAAEIGAAAVEGQEAQGK